MLAMDDRALANRSNGTDENMRLMYNIHGTINPVSGETYGPNTLGLISELVRAFDGGNESS